MEHPANSEWRTRVLRDEELSQLLATKSPLESMDILSKQVELRTIEPLEPKVAPAPPAAPAASAPVQQEKLAFDPVLAESSSAIPIFEDQSQPKTEPVKRARKTTDTGKNKRIETGQLPTITPSEPTPVAAELPVAPSRDDFEEPVPIEPPATSTIPVSSIDEEVPAEKASAFDALATRSADIPSVEEVVTEFEESHQEEALPELVDEIIKSVGGEDDLIIDPNAEPDSEAQKLEEFDDLITNSNKKVTNPDLLEESLAHVEPTRTKNARSLLATWNGTGVLLLMVCLGYVGALGNMSLSSLLAGSFVAMAITGFGFASAALAARRGHQPQSILSRAAFGVNGAAIPLVPVAIARIATTAMLALFAVAGFNWFFADVPASVTLPVGSERMQIGSGYLVAVAVLVLGWLATLLGKRTTSWINRILAVVLIGGSAAIVVFGYLQHPEVFVIDGKIDFTSALGTASLVAAIIGMLWGTSAADENLDLRTTTVVPKLLAAGLLNFTVLGSLAAVAGFSFYQLKNDNLSSLPLGIAFGVAVIFTFSNLIRRNADSLAGLGLARAGFVTRASTSILAALICLLFVWKLSGDSAWSMFTSYLTFGAVPVLSWLTIFGVDSVLRTTQYHEVSLLRSYGFYGRFNLANLIGWLLATALGWGFLTIELPEFAWLGYFANLLDIAPTSLSANLGIWIAMGFSILVPIVFTIPRIREQEAEVKALEARRTELLDVLGISE